MMYYKISVSVKYSIVEYRYLLEAITSQRHFGET